MTRAALSRGYAAFGIPTGSILDFRSAANFNEVTANVTATTDAAVTWRGRPTVRLDVAAALVSANVEIGVSGQTAVLPEGIASIYHAGPMIAVKSPRALAAAILYLGDATYANVNNITMFAPAVIDADGFYVFTYRGGVSNAFGVTGTNVYRQGELKRSKVRLGRASGATAETLHIAYAGVEPPTRPKVIITLDDGDDEHYTYTYPTAKARGIPISFSIASGLIDTPGYMTAAQIQEIANDSSGLFEMTNHAVDNTHFGTLGLAGYAAAAETCRDYLLGLGLDEDAANCHVYVGGLHDATVDEELKARGFLCAREVGATNRAAHPIRCINDASATTLFGLPASANLETGHTRATVLTNIGNARAIGGSFFIMGHKFAAAAGASTWINSTDATYGFTGLLDDLVTLRNKGQVDIVKLSDWYRGLSGHRRAA